MSILRSSILILTCLVAAHPAAAQPGQRSALPTPTPVPAAQGTAAPSPMPPPASGPSRSTASDDGPIGRKFIEPSTIPESLPQAEAILQAPTAEEEASGGLALDSLLQMACQNNPTLLQARMQVTGTLGKAIQAGLWPNPVVTYVGEQIGVGGTPGEFQGGIVEQEIVTAHKRQLSREKYLQRARVAEFLAVAQQWRVCNDIRIHFWRTLGHRQIVDVRRELLKSAEDVAVTGRERWNLGQITRAELHMADVALQTARLELMRSDNRYRREFNELAAVVGTDMSPQPLDGQLDVATEDWIEFDAALGRLYQESPEVLAARAKWRADQITLRREEVEPIPNLVLRGGAGHNFEAGETTYVAQLAIEVPLWDKNQGTIQQAQADLARQQGEIRRTQLRLRRDLSMQYEQYLTALQHVIEFQTVILPEARTAYANQLDAYKENRQNWSDVLDAQKVYFDLRQRYIEHLIAQRTSEVLINGFLLHDALMAPPNPTPPGHIDATPQPR